MSSAALGWLWFVELAAYIIVITALVLVFFVPTIDHLQPAHDTYNVGLNPNGVAVTPNGTYAYVANSNGYGFDGSDTGSLTVSFTLSH